MASFSADFGPSALLAPGPKYAAKGKSLYLAVYADLFLDKNSLIYIFIYTFDLFPKTDKYDPFKSA
jgi:hypothetical protein